MSMHRSNLRDTAAITRKGETTPPHSLYGIAALALSVVACYGTLALVALLASFGVVLSPDETVWKGAIVVFALLTVVAVGMGMRRHGSRLPAATALAGAALLTLLMTWHFDRVLELLAFALIAAAVFADRRLHSCRPGTLPTPPLVD